MYNSKHLMPQEWPEPLKDELWDLYCEIQEDLKDMGLTQRPITTTKQWVTFCEEVYTNEQKAP